MQVGPGATPRLPTCAVREEYLSPKEAQDQYRQVGVICHVGGWQPAGLVPPSTGSWASFDTPPVDRRGGARPLIDEPATLIDDVREDTCRLGGEIIVRHGFCGFRLRASSSHGSASGVEFGIYALRSPPP